MVYIIVIPNSSGKYSLTDSVNERIFRTPEEAWRRLDEIQPLYSMELIVVGY